MGKCNLKILIFDRLSREMGREESSGRCIGMGFSMAATSQQGVVLVESMKAVRLPVGCGFDAMKGMVVDRWRPDGRALMGSNNVESQRGGSHVRGSTKQPP